MISVMIAGVLLTQAVPGPTPAQFETARRLLDQNLIDYPSARFRDVHGTPLVICGFVNSKNRLGAYAGWTRFAALVGDDPRLISDGGDDAEVADINLDAFCGDDGRRLGGPDFSDRLTPR